MKLATTCSLFHFNLPPRIHRQIRWGTPFRNMLNALGVTDHTYNAWCQLLACVQVIFGTWALGRGSTTHAGLKRLYQDVITTDVISRVVSQSPFFQGFHTAGRWKAFGRDERNEKLLDVITKINVGDDAPELARSAMPSSIKAILAAIVADDDSSLPDVPTALPWRKLTYPSPFTKVSSGKGDAFEDHQDDDLEKVECVRDVATTSSSLEAFCVSNTNSAFSTASYKI